MFLQKRLDQFENKADKHLRRNCKVRVPEWEELVYTPAVFVRVANTGVRGYGTWKSAQAHENKRAIRERLIVEGWAQTREKRYRRGAECAEASQRESGTRVQSGTFRSNRRAGVGDGL